MNRSEASYAVVNRIGDAEKIHRLEASYAAVNRLEASYTEQNSRVRIILRKSELVRSILEAGRNHL